MSDTVKQTNNETRDTGLTHLVTHSNRVPVSSNRRCVMAVRDCFSVRVLLVRAAVAGKWLQKADVVLSRTDNYNKAKYSNIQTLCQDIRHVRRYLNLRG